MQLCFLIKKEGKNTRVFILALWRVVWESIKMLF